ncbi:unnamed protein product [Alopecurus aequalis]
MCNAINTIPSLLSLLRALRRRRSRAAASVRPDKDPTVDAASAVPAGHVAVLVEGRAGDPRRFVVRLAQLSHPAFRELLRQAEEEYGFPPGASGPLALPCDEDRLRDILRRVSPSPVTRTATATSSVAAAGGDHGEAHPVIDQSFLRLCTL